LDDSRLYLMMCCGFSCVEILNPAVSCRRCAHHCDERTLCLHPIPRAQIFFNYNININE